MYKKYSTLAVLLTVALVVMGLMSCSKKNPAAPAVAAATCTISGVVTDSANGTAIASAGVTTIPASSSVTTTAAGQFTITGVSAGSYTVTATKTGYINKSVVVAVTAGNTATANISLSAGVAGNNAPTVPSILSPADSSICDTTLVTLKWACTDPDSGDTLRYDVYFGTINPPSAIVSANQAADSLVRSGLVPSTTYYWKIVAKDNHTSTTNGPVWQFATVSPIAAPVLLTPVDGFNGIATNPVLTWDVSVGATTYTLQVSLSSTFSSYAVNQSGINLTSMAISGLSSSTVYYWRVKATDGTYSSAWSGAQSFTTSPTGTFPLSQHSGIATSVASNVSNTISSIDDLTSALGSGNFTPKSLKAPPVGWVGPDAGGWYTYSPGSDTTKVRFTPDVWAGNPPYRKPSKMEYQYIWSYSTSNLQYRLYQQRMGQYLGLDTLASVAEGYCNQTVTNIVTGGGGPMDLSYVWNSPFTSATISYSDKACHFTFTSTYPFYVSENPAAGVQYVALVGEISINASGNGNIGGEVDFGGFATANSVVFVKFYFGPGGSYYTLLAENWTTHHTF